jgi:hypothetical protein
MKIRFIFVNFSRRLLLGNRDENPCHPEQEETDDFSNV